MTESHPPASPLPRRAMLAASGTAVLAVAAACSGGTSTATTPASSTAAATSSKASSAASSSAATTSAATSSAPASSAATSAATSAEAAAPTGTPLASVADVQAAGALVVGDGSNPYLLAYSGDTVVAHTAICTHQQCAIAASGNCPCHGSEFNVTTGAVIKGPAQRPLAELPVTISGGQVYRA
ncbi:MAG TPA: Rieske (2Fe-2S) protein [Nakamurella multipartita]|nr:Rieske (2Fe-2S) protein [Nakamurella multipartita]